MAYRIQLPESGESFESEAGESVLEAAERAGIALPHDCRLGGCATCRVRLLEGTVSYEEMPFALTQEDEAAGYALACQAHACSDLIIRPEQAELNGPDPQRHSAVLKAITALNDDVIHLRLAIPGAGPLDFLPGQYLKVHLADGSTRNFSMASRPGAEVLDFHVRRIPGGRFTDFMLGELRPGDALDVELPHGNFFYRGADYRPLLMVATGTGLAPIKSILESLHDDPDCPPVSLYWGARTRADLYLHDQIAAWGERLCDFRYVPVLSRADASWSGRRGHVQQAVCADHPDLSEHAIYLCGSPLMITDASRAFAARQASSAHLYADNFSFQHEPGAAVLAA
jgi:CDP-4-dehydro-6-deoxyglucose reductase